MDMTTNYGQLGSTIPTPQSMGLTASGAAPNITPPPPQQNAQPAAQAPATSGSILSQVAKPMMGATAATPAQIGNTQAATHNGIMSGLTNLFGGNGVSPTRPTTPQISMPTSGPLAGHQPFDFSHLFSGGSGNSGGWPGAQQASAALGQSAPLANAMPSGGGMSGGFGAMLGGFL